MVVVLDVRRPRVGGVKVWDLVFYHSNCRGGVSMTCTLSSNMHISDYTLSVSCVR